MNSTTIIVPDRGTYAVISDVIEELTLEDIENSMLVPADHR